MGQPSEKPGSRRGDARFDLRDHGLAHAGARPELRKGKAHFLSPPAEVRGNPGLDVHCSGHPSTIVSSGESGQSRSPRSATFAAP